LRRFYRDISAESSVEEERAIDVERTSRISLLSHVQHYSTTIFRDDLPRKYKQACSSRAQYTLVHKAYGRFGNGCKRAIDDVHRRYCALHSAAMTHFNDAPTRPRIPFGIRPRRAGPVVLRLLRELREHIQRRLYPMKYTKHLTLGRVAHLEAVMLDVKAAKKYFNQMLHKIFSL